MLVSRHIKLAAGKELLAGTLCERSWMRWVAVLILSIAVGLAAATQPVAAGTGLDRFFGDYTGRSIQAGPGQDLEPRDLDVKISPHGKGFAIEWTTVIYRATGPTRKTYSVEFGRSGRDGIFTSAMRRDVFGHEEPLDPMKGEPYVWARLAGSTLTIFALLITDEGGYEIQTYDRTLTDDGLELRYTRDRDGKVLPPVIGSLKRLTP
jgi:hypothetical protein